MSHNRPVVILGRDVVVPVGWFRSGSDTPGCAVGIHRPEPKLVDDKLLVLLTRPIDFGRARCLESLHGPETVVSCPCLRLAVSVCER